MSDYFLSLSLGITGLLCMGACARTGGSFGARLALHSSSIAQAYSRFREATLAAWWRFLVTLFGALILWAFSGWNDAWGHRDWVLEELWLGWLTLSALRAWPKRGIELSDDGCSDARGLPLRWPIILAGLALVRLDAMGLDYASVWVVSTAYLHSAMLRHRSTGRGGMLEGALAAVLLSQIPWVLRALWLFQCSGPPPELNPGCWLCLCALLGALLGSLVGHYPVIQSLVPSSSSESWLRRLVLLFLLTVSLVGAGWLGNSCINGRVATSRPGSRLAEPAFARAEHKQRTGLPGGGPEQDKAS